MVYVAAVLAVFLFYYFVPKNHKITFFKVAGILVVIGGILAGAFVWHDNWKSEQKRAWISVDFLELTGGGDKGEKTASIKVCNNHVRPLLKYEVNVSGLREGRSTKYKLIKDYSDEGSTELKGDIIIAPKSCQTITWTGPFQTFDRYEAWSSYYMNSWERED